MSNEKSDQTPYGCIGAVVAALIAAAALIFVSLPDLTAFFQQPTATPMLASRSSDLLSATVHNYLYRPIEVYVNGSYRGQVAEQSNEPFYFQGEPAQINFAVVRMLNDQTGRAYGLEISGTFFQVLDGQDLYVDNTVGDHNYFYPVVSNRTDDSCEIVINEGTFMEDHIGYAPAHMDNIISGYYELTFSSTVVLYCGDERVKSYWGRMPNTSGDPLNNIVDPTSGYVALVLSP